MVDIIGTLKTMGSAPNDSGGTELDGAVEALTALRLTTSSDRFQRTLFTYQKEFITFLSSFRQSTVKETPRRTKAFLDAIGRCANEEPATVPAEEFRSYANSVRNIASSSQLALRNAQQAIASLLTGA